MAEQDKDQTSYMDAQGNPAPSRIPSSAAPTSDPLVTWGTPEMYQGTGTISKEPPIDLSQANSATAQDMFNLPPQQNPLSPAYTYQPTTPQPPNLANDPSMSGTGTVSLPPAPITGQPGGITRDNPFGGPPIPPPAIPNPSLNPVQPPVTPQQALTPPAMAPVPSGPLPTDKFNAAMIQNMEQSKGIAANHAANLSQGQAEAARIQSEGAAKQRQMLEGDPAALLKAQQDHAAALKLPDSDPNKRALLQQSEFNIRNNEGARPALIRAQIDAERRDNDIREMIKKAQARTIDPDRYWASKSTGAKVLAGIGMILAGAGSGMTGQPNLAFQQLNAAISRDIDAQRADIDNNWKAIAEMKGVNDTAFNRELHRQSWENNYRTAALETIKLDLAANAAQTESQSVKTRAQEAIQTLTEQQLTLRNKQYLLGVAAQAGELKRVRELQKEAQADVMKLVEKDGVSVEQAERTVYSSPRYSDIASRAPAHVQGEIAQTNALKAQYVQERSKLEGNAKTLGLKPGTEQYNKYIQSNIDMNKYKTLFTGERENPIGTVVPQKATGGAAESAKDIKDRTVFVPTYNSKGEITGSVPKLAVNEKQALAFSAYNDAAPQFREEYAKLKQAAKDGKKGEYEQARAVMIDLFPKFKFGSTNAPTDSQKKTAEDIIPDWNSWYTANNQTNVDQKLSGIAKMIEDREKTIHRDTFGSSTSAPPAPSSGGGSFSGKEPPVPAPTEYDPVTKKPIGK